ncbi:MAG: S8 family peptidase [Saprospiraceae bacterium]|nr:S8 family peptidase [Saprospiraceae bacterium]
MYWCILFLFLPSLFCLNLYAQEYHPQQFIVELNSDTELRTFVKDFSVFQNQPTTLSIKKRLIPHMNIWLVEYDNSAIQEGVLLNDIRKHPAVKTAQYNHIIQHRHNQSQNLIPNDPFYTSQWQYNNNGSGGGAVDADINAPQAWALSTGGYTFSGDTIVVAVLDDGVDIDHTDLQNNLWINHQEIPNNNIDDDQNGYIDDYLGWNPILENDHVGTGVAGAHGTPVSGVIGAKGDNGTAVAGVNWTVKLMIIRSGLSTDEATVIASYGYALQQRKLYNESNGTKGAFVVATNASWGVNFGQASDAPIWCSFYDTLGYYGILNVGATANLNINVDTDGDLPTTCPSDYLIGVTNVNRLGDKVFGAAYGSTHIDLGAPGETIYTLKNNNAHGTFGGTSGAAPHVTAAIALAYASTCENFNVFTKVQPSQAALAIKNAILTGVKPESTLSNTLSGGYLDLHQTLINSQDACPNNCFPPYQLEDLTTTGSSSVIHWLTSVLTDSVQFSYRLLGGNWSAAQIIDNNNSSLNNLQACSDYEVRLISFCNGNLGDTTFYSFRTDGCCDIPSALTTSVTVTNSTLLEWNDQLAALSYDLRYRLLGTNDWMDTIANINTNQYELSTLNNCTYYEYQVRMYCNSGVITNFSESKIFVTDGCTSCAVTTYCDAMGQNAQDDFIQKFRLGDFEHNSGNNSGYLLYDDDFINVDIGQTYPITVQQGGNFLEQVRVWLDYNQDGDFADAGELIFEDDIPYVSSTSGQFTIPDTIVQGITRLRVAMQWTAPPGLCTDPMYGEVEDYCVHLLPSLSSSVKDVNKVSMDAKIFPNPFHNDFYLKIYLEQPQDIHCSLWNALGQEIETFKFDQLAVGNHQLHIYPQTKTRKGIYYLQIQTEQKILTLPIQRY